MTIIDPQIVIYKSTGTNPSPLHESTRVVLYFIAFNGQIYIGAQGYATKREAYKVLWAVRSAIWQAYARAPRCYFLRNIQNLCNKYTVKERLM